MDADSKIEYPAITVPEGRETGLQNKNLDKRAFILRCLFDSNYELKGIGRRKILEIAKESKYYITETDIRKIVCDLNLEGLVEIHKGRGGMNLTQKGREITIKTMG